MKQIKRIRCKFELNEFSWSANSDHLLIAGATGSSDVMRGVIEVKAFDGAELLDIPGAGFPAHTASCFALRLDPALQRLAVGSSDFCVSLWELDDLTCYAACYFE
jgi:hypothetical protein